MLVRSTIGSYGSQVRAAKVKDVIQRLIDRGIPWENIKVSESSYKTGYSSSTTHYTVFWLEPEDSPPYR